MTRVFSGNKPTGHLTLGNYLGAMRRWAAVDQHQSDPSSRPSIAPEQLFKFTGAAGLCQIHPLPHTSQ